MPDVLKEYLVFTFPSTYYALKAEKALLARGYDIPLSPLPRQLSSNCGEVIRVEPEMKVEIRDNLLAANVEIEEIHLVQEKKKTNLMDKFFGY